MTIIEAINFVDDVKPNTYTQEQKVAWLSELDGKIVSQVIATHHRNCGEEIDYEGYTTEDLTKELIAKAPYDTLYIAWLEAQIDYADNEMQRYANTSAMFNERYGEWARWYNRTHQPKGARIRYW